MWTYDSGNVPIKATPLMVDGLLYFSVPDKAWAVDARTGRMIWCWETKTRGGTHIGHREMAMYGKWVFLVTPDDYLVSLEAATGKERWRTEIADLKLDYFATVAPVIIRNHVLVSRVLNQQTIAVIWILTIQRMELCNGVGIRHRIPVNQVLRRGPTQRRSATGEGQSGYPARMILS